MNLASLELCKELFELSDWLGESDQELYSGNFRCPEDGGLLDNGGMCFNEHFPEDDRIPAYDLGYLLRKLKELTDNVELIDNYAWWECGSRENYVEKQKGDTPENAAAKLAIELLKQGVLPGERLAPKGESKLSGTEET